MSDSATDAPFLTSQQLADLLTVEKSTVEEWRRTGRGPRFHRVGKHVRYNPAAVEAWLDANEVKPTAASA